LSRPRLCRLCVFWNGMADEIHKQAHGFYRDEKGRLSFICRSHAEADKKITMIDFHAGQDEYLVQEVMEE
jgi:hypothetical protein